MRGTRIAVALAAAVCVFGAFSAPAFAKKQKAVFGKFFANVPGQTISTLNPVEANGIGELEHASLGPIEITSCHELKSKSTITSELSETFNALITFRKCRIPLVTLNVENKNENVEEEQFTKFSINATFHSNGSGEVGGGVGELEVSSTPISFKIGKSPCILKIPPQTIPFRAAVKTEKEYEAAEYETYKESVSGKHKLAMFPSGFQDELEVYFEEGFKKITWEVPQTTGCKIKAPFNETTKVYENNNGLIEGYLEEIIIKDGNIGFQPKEEV